MVEPLSDSDVKLMHSCLRTVAHTTCDARQMVEVGRVNANVQVLKDTLQRRILRDAHNMQEAWDLIDVLVDERFGGLK
jgi:hypothetical protein